MKTTLEQYLNTLVTQERYEMVDAVQATLEAIEAAKLICYEQFELQGEPRSQATVVAVARMVLGVGMSIAGGAAAEVDEDEDEAAGFGATGFDEPDGSADEQ